MALQILFWSILAVVTLVGLPIVLVSSLVSHLRSRGSERRGGGGVSSGVGAALQEIDRLMARPSVEHKVEIEKHVTKREDDTGGQ